MKRVLENWMKLELFIKLMCLKMKFDRIFKILILAIGLYVCYLGANNVTRKQSRYTYHDGDNRYNIIFDLIVIY